MPNKKDASLTHFEQLQKELNETKEVLQNTIKELETSTKELKSSYEEALSTNGKLRAVNDQLRDKIGQLQSTNDEWENFFSSTNIPTVFLNNSLKIQQFTPAAALLLGIGNTDTGRDIHALRSDLLDDNFINEAKKVLITFESVHTEIKSQNNHWYIRGASPYITEDKRIEGIVVTFQDISEIKRLSESANRRERQQATVAQLGMLALNNISIEAFMDNLVRQVAHTLNVEYCKILKYRPDKSDLLLISGTGWHKGIVGYAAVPDKQDSQAGFTLMQKEPVIVNSMSEEKRFYGPTLLQDHDVVCGMSVVINHSNPPYGVLGVHSSSYAKFDADDAQFIQSIANLLSITIKNYDANEALQESENRLRIAKESGSIGAFEYYIDTGHLKWDMLIKKLWGYSKFETLTIENFYEAVHPDDRERVEEEIEKSTNPKGNGHYSAKFRVINIKNKKTYWVQGNGKTEFTNGIPLKMIGMIQNITDSKQLELSLQKAVNELKEVNQRKNEFLATLGHELRNPLSAISGSIDILKINSDDNAPLVNMLDRNTKTMSNMLDDLLDLSRIDNGTVRLERKTVNMKELIERTVFEYTHLFASKNQRVELIMDDKPMHVNGDPIRLEQVLGNLLTNAQKFTPENGKIVVSAEVSDIKLSIKVKDNGIGLAGNSETIFEPFSQIDPSKGNNGLGIGLALVKRFTEMHDAEIAVQSEGIGKGCTFTLTFPLIQSSETKHISKKGTDVGSASIKKGLRVMIVDDNSDSSELLKMYLTKYKCDVILAYNAAEALEMVKDARPEVFLLDIGLPDMDGCQLFKEIKKLYQKPAVYVAHTGYGHEEAKQETKRAGFDYHFTKPLEMKKFLGLLASIE